ncbi:uncharacterized protein [Hoplias malabaricus]|uniref:uncharacterized protein n=1 Tax=Hoplias malabaricus TaxID=27720 RepID=UPI003462FFD8
MPFLPKEGRVRKNVKEGETVVLHCNVPESSVAPTISWMDKRLRFISQSERVTTGLDGNLYFANTLVEDIRDDYTCNAQYIEARTIIAKEPISLTVTPSDQDLRQRPPQLHRLPGTRSHYLALRGKSLTLECIPHGLPTPTVVWEKKDGSLSASSAVRERFHRWLTFKNISENVDGEYSCTASNTLGKVTHSYIVTVQAAPYWSKQPQSHRYAPGETVRLDCQAEGIPTPNITWRINGVPIQETNEEPRRRVSRGTLILNDVRYDDTAVYECEASNQHGTILINIYIHIIDLSPQILTSDKLLYNITEGDSASLDCVSFGSPWPQISWESENMETVLSDPRVSQLTNGTLRITDVRSEDAGAYSCSVKHFNLSIVAYLAVLKINHSEHPLLQFTSDSSPPSESNTTPAAGKNHPLLQFCISTNDYSPPSESYTTPAAEEKLVSLVIKRGLVVNDSFVQVSPLFAPSTRITVSNVPPFIPNDALGRELARYGKITSLFTNIPLGCKHPALKHVVSFRRNVYMILDPPVNPLDISLRVKHEGRTYTVYASTGSMRCFECGDVGHKRLACPHKRQEEDNANTDANVDGRPGASTAGDAAPEEGGASDSQVGRAGAQTEQREVPAVVEPEPVVPSTSAAGLQKCPEECSAVERQEPLVTDSQMDEGLSDEGDVGSQSTLSELDSSQVEPSGDAEAESQGPAQVDRSLYSLEEVNHFLDETYGKQVNVTDFFPDVDKFVRSVAMLQRNVGLDALSEKKRFRLKKHVTFIRKSGKVAKRKSSSLQ